MMSVGQFIALLGVVEVVIGVLLAIRHVWMLGSATGSGLTTPGWEPSLGGFTVLPDRGRQFLIKDVVLLGPALNTAGEALEGARGGRPAAPVPVS
jgi:reactive chlorine resistance protein C